MAIISSQDINYDESLVDDFELPDPLISKDGNVVEKPDDWYQRARPEILELFCSEVYGRLPGSPNETEYRLLSQEESTLDATAVRREIAATFTTGLGALEIRIALFLPIMTSEPVPVFLGLNFGGNHTVSSDPGVDLPLGWVANDELAGISDNNASEVSRGAQAGRWPISMIVKRGYGVATAYCGDLDPDYDDGFLNGAHPLFPRNDSDGTAWGTISAWAWGLHRIIDYLEIDSGVDQARIAVIGHSRLGKTALWAAATDPRVAMAISNSSGCGGASLARRHFGETVARITTVFPHWFCRNYRKYGPDPALLPVDQHMLISLIAPRPLYVASAEEDHWADPRGEFLSALNAGPVYELLGARGLAIREMPPIEMPVIENRVGYHVRSGRHDITDYDWRQYLDFADIHLR